MTLKLGQRVRVQRDEVVHPPRGTWSMYRGCEGTVVQHNDHDHEYGIVLGMIPKPRPDRPGLSYDGSTVVWFSEHELVAV